MKTHIEQIKEKYKNAKEVRSSYGTIGLYFEETIYTSHTGSIFFKSTDEKLCLYSSTNGQYAEIISYIEPTTEVRNSVLLQLADNNSYSEEILKKECPKLFAPTDIITIVEKYGKDELQKYLDKL